MDSQNLKAFIAVAECQSFSKAGKKLFLTQPAVSKRISTLEDELGTALFDRIGRTTQLTEAGRALLPRAQSILLELDDAQRAIHNLTGNISGKLNIGTSHHIGLHRLAPVLKQFTRENPGVQLDIRFLDSEEGCNCVENGSLELAIVTLPAAPSAKLLIEEIWDDPLSFVFASDHPLARPGRPLTIKDLAQHTAILPAVGTFTRDIIDIACQKKGLELPITMETNYLETIKMMVSIGLGWSALPNQMIDGDLAKANVEGLHLSRSLGTVIHRERTLSNAAQALLNTLQCQQQD